MSWYDLMWLGDRGATAPIENIALSLLLGFVIGQVIGWVYMATHTTPSYSSSFVASLVVLPVIVALMMILMSGSLMIAFGLLAVFAVVRFRNVLKDTRDTTYILWAIVEGMAAGTFRYSTALVGTTAVVLVMFYLWFTEFGIRRRFDAALSVSIPSDLAGVREQVEQILRRFSDRTVLTGERQMDRDRNVLSYRLLLRDPARRRELSAELASAGNVEEMSFYLQEDESEL
jgi:uncharacterized membrane protein YhiD involved in acid resistance